MTDPISQCCQSRIYLDPIIVMPQQVTIGRVPRCAACHRFKGEAKILYSAPKALAAKWTGSSEAAMLDHHAKTPGRPLWFEDGAFLRPVGYKGEVKQQAEMAEEPPF